MLKMQVRYLSVILSVVWSTNIFCGFAVSFEPVKNDGWDRIIKTCKVTRHITFSPYTVTVTNDGDNIITINRAMIYPKPLSREDFLKLTIYPTRALIPLAMFCGLLGGFVIALGKKEFDRSRYIGDVLPFMYGGVWIAFGWMLALAYPLELEANKELGEFANQLMSGSDVLTVEPHQKKSFLVVFKDYQPQNIEIVL